MLNHIVHHVHEKQEHVKGEISLYLAFISPSVVLESSFFSWREIYPSYPYKHKNKFKSMLVCALLCALHIASCTTAAVSGLSPWLLDSSWVVVVHG